MFSIITAVRQGCILSHFLFFVIMDYTIRKSIGKPSVRHLAVGVMDARLSDLDFADDIAVLSNVPDVMQEMTVW